MTESVKPEMHGFLPPCPPNKGARIGIILARLKNWAIRGSIPGRRKKLSSSKRPNWFWCPPSSLLYGYLGLLPRIWPVANRPRCDTKHTPSTSRIRLWISRTIPPFPLYVFITWTGKLCLCLCLCLYLYLYPTFCLPNAVGDWICARNDNGPSAL